MQYQSESLGRKLGKGGGKLFANKLPNSWVSSMHGQLRGFFGICFGSIGNHKTMSSILSSLYNSDLYHSIIIIYFNQALISNNYNQYTLYYIIFVLFCLIIIIQIQPSLSNKINVVNDNHNSNNTQNEITNLSCTGSLSEKKAKSITNGDLFNHQDNHSCLYCITNIIIIIYFILCFNQVSVSNNISHLSTSSINFDKEQGEANGALSIEDEKDQSYLIIVEPDCNYGASNVIQCNKLDGILYANYYYSTNNSNNCSPYIVIIQSQTHKQTQTQTQQYFDFSSELLILPSRAKCDACNCCAIGYDGKLVKEKVYPCYNASFGPSVYLISKINNYILSNNKGYGYINGTSIIIDIYYTACFDIPYDGYVVSSSNIGIGYGVLARIG